MSLIQCKDCEYENTESCVVRKSIKGAILTPDSGCTEGKEKEKGGEDK